MGNYIRLSQAACQLNIPIATLRDIRFKASDRFASDGKLIAGNGFGPAFVTLGRAVYVDIPKFLEIWHFSSINATSKNATTKTSTGGA